MDRIEFVRDPLKTSLILIGGIALIAGSVWMALDDDDVIHRGIGVLGVVFFGLAVIQILRSLMRGGAVFTFDASGIRLQQPALVIAWSEIEAFSIVEVRQSKFFAIQFRNPEQFFARVSSLQAKLARFNSAVGWGHWSLPFAGIKPGIDVAMQFAQQHRA